MSRIRQRNRCRAGARPCSWQGSFCRNTLGQTWIRARFHRYLMFRVARPPGPPFRHKRHQPRRPAAHVSPPAAPSYRPVPRPRPAAPHTVPYRALAPPPPTPSRTAPSPRRPPHRPVAPPRPAAPHTVPYRPSGPSLHRQTDAPTSERGVLTSLSIRTSRSLVQNRQANRKCEQISGSPEPLRPGRAAARPQPPPARARPPPGQALAGPRPPPGHASAGTRPQPPPGQHSTSAGDVRRLGSAAH
jgi:hypothetical protein